MSRTDTEEFEGGRLFNLYTRYVTEPESKRDVYGYTILLGGYVLALAGMGIYLLGPTDGPANAVTFLFREVSFTVAGVGLIMTLFGIVIMLPVRRLAVVVGAVGTALGLGASAWFVQVYPANWGVGTPDYSSSIVTVYTVGIALVAGVVVLLPVVTGERSYFAAARDVLATDHPDIMVGEADRGGQFTIFRRQNDWTWRLIDQTALAASTDDFLSRLETEDRVDRIKDTVEEAGMLELTHAAFRLYQAAEDRWRWLLMQENGTVVADSSEEYPSRQAAETSVNDLKELGPAAQVFAIEAAALETYPTNGQWSWRFIDGSRDALAAAPESYQTRDSAHAAAEVFGDRAATAPVFSLERYGIELYQDGDLWRWRLLDSEFDTLGTAVTEYDTKGGVEDAVYDLLDRLGDAAVVSTSEPSFDVFEPAPGRWEWRLVTAEGRTTAVSTDSGAAAASVADDARAFKREAQGAEALELPNQEFEIYRTDGAWHWRLVDDNRNERAHSVEAYESQREAADALEHLQLHAPDAELIEFERAAFQIYESDEGRWRWRLIDEDGNVLADSSEGEYESRDGAMGAMSTIREYAPDAEQIEIETAAFELFEEAGQWGWRLVDDLGDTLARGRHRYDDRDEAEGDMEALREEVSHVDVRVMENGVFQVYHDETDTWWWQFIMPDGSLVASSPDGFGTRHEAEDAVETLREDHLGAEVATIGRLAVLLDPVGGRWTWQFVDHDRNPIAEAAEPLATRDDAQSVARDLQRTADSVTVFEIREAAFLVTDGDGWGWTLFDADHTALAVGSVTYGSVEEAEEAVDEITDLADVAEFIQYDQAAYEVYETDAGWQWQLIDEQRSIMAAGTEVYDTRTDVEAAIEAIRDELDEASILEIERAAFEFHKGDDGWRFRLIDETGNELAESLHAYDSRTAAREAMTAVQEHAPEAWVTIAD